MAGTTEITGTGRLRPTGRTAVLPILCLIALAGCGSKPYGVHVADSELLPKVRKIAIWPSSAVPMVGTEAGSAAIGKDLGADSTHRADALQLNQFIDSVLTRAIGFYSEIATIPPDSMEHLLRDYVPDYSRLNPPDWRQYRHLAVADAILTIDVSFHLKDSYVDSYVTLSLYDRESGRLIAESKADDPRGMWAGSPPSVYVTLDYALKRSWLALEETLTESVGDELKWWIQ